MWNRKREEKKWRNWVQKPTLASSERERGQSARKALEREERRWQQLREAVDGPSGVAWRAFFLGKENFLVFFDCEAPMRFFHRPDAANM